jgi:hypothetical protein
VICDFDDIGIVSTTMTLFALIAQRLQECIQAVYVALAHPMLARRARAVAHGDVGV